MNGCHVAFVGRITRPGEFRYASTGTPMLRVGVMVDDTKRPENEPPQFADVTVWGETAEALAERLPKGTDLYVEGRAKTRAWAGQDGAPRASLEVSAWKAEPLGQIGRQAPRRPAAAEQLRRPNAMPEAMAVGVQRNRRQQLGLDDVGDLEDVPF